MKFSFFVLLLFTGCDRRPIHVKPTPSAIVGLWQVTSREEPVIMRVSFAADGTFHQEILTPLGVTLHTTDGTWEVDNEYVVLRSPLQFVENRWQPVLCSWTLVDDKSRPGSQVLFGGVFPDPDVYETFSRTSTAPATASTTRP